MLALAQPLQSPQIAAQGFSEASLEAETRATLAKVGREGTWQGVAALKAARLVDQGGYTAQGAAALFKTHREALLVALEGAGADADVVDLIFGADAG